MPQRKNLVLKVLIVLGLLAILASAYVQYGVPYLEEQEKEKNDEQRIADVNALDAEVKSIFSINPSAFTGASTTVYISLPSNDLLCTDLELPSLPDGWTYRCASPSDYTNANGTGWLPINFAIAEHSNILENVGMLPVDPRNSADTLNYYAFVGRSTFSTTTAATSTEYVLTAVLDSKKYLIETAQTDGGSDPIRYEVGHLPKLWSDANGLLGYWPMRDNVGSQILADRSGRDIHLTLGDPAAQSQSDCQNECLAFTGPQQQLSSKKIEDYSIQNGATVVLWVSFERSSDEAYELLIAHPLVLYGYVSGSMFDILGSVYSDQRQFFSRSKSSTSFNEWHQVGLIYGYFDQLESFGIGNILDGSVRYVDAGPKLSATEATRLIINNRSLYSGEIRGLSIYHRTLHEKEIRRLFEGS